MLFNTFGLIRTSRLQLPIVAQGGNVSVQGDYIVHEFTDVGADTFDVKVAPDNAEIEVLVVGGGGGGASSGNANYKGGGGAGGLIITKMNLSGVNQYPIVVGDGGAVNSNGSDSSAFGLTAFGGGAGAGTYNTSGSSGGSGGGGAPLSAAGGSGVSGQGTSGGFGSSANLGGQDSGAGGGGGATEMGRHFNSNSFTNSSGAGGQGIELDISGTPKFYAAGGTGAAFYMGVRASGIGGASSGRDGVGGPFVQRSQSQKNGLANTGAGGAGANHHTYSGESAGSGGSGIVIIRYRKPRGLSAFGGEISVRGRYAIHQFKDVGADSFEVVRESENSELNEIEYVIVAGGGGGGGNASGSSQNRGGGGGAGGLIKSEMAVAEGSYSVTVGAGGSPNSQGQSSFFNGTEVFGGGFGGTENSNGGPGGSGGGGGGSGGGEGTGQPTRSGGAGTPGQGHDGGTTGPNNNNRGGGGGAIGPGVVTTPGEGMNLSSWIPNTILASGALGGQSNSQPGVSNTGDGGEGGNNAGEPPSSGGSGIVIIRYRLR